MVIPQLVHIGPDTMFSQPVFNSNSGVMVPGQLPGVAASTFRRFGELPKELQMQICGSVLETQTYDVLLSRLIYRAYNERDVDPRLHHTTWSKLLSITNVWDGIRPRNILLRTCTLARDLALDKLREAVEAVCGGEGGM